jgi:precorrin-4/cobalt-precorrin-4 C11-methyltransferase
MSTPQQWDSPSQGRQLYNKITAKKYIYLLADVITGPAVYSAVFEQMRQLNAAGIIYAVVPGLSSAFAAAASLGVELTIPEQTQIVIFTRLEGRTPMPDRERLRDLAAHRSSLVIFLSVGMVARVVDELYAAGYKPDEPAAVLYRASWPEISTQSCC